MILIIAAMMEELDALRKKGSHIREKKVQGVHCVEMTLSNQSVVLALSGVGKINASMSASLLAMHYKPSLIINIGSAGGLHPHQKVGDIVIADQVQSHDLDIGENTPFDPRFIYKASNTLNDDLEKILKKLNFNYNRGLIVSGDQFVVFESHAFHRIKKYYEKAICVEMEATAIGAVANQLGIDFVVIRSISDNPYEKNNEATFEAFLALASENSAQITEAFLENYP